MDFWWIRVWGQYTHTTGMDVHPPFQIAHTDTHHHHLSLCQQPILTSHNLTTHDRIGGIHKDIHEYQ